MNEGEHSEWQLDATESKLYIPSTINLKEAALKFIYSEKATKFCEIFNLLLTTDIESKVRWKFRKILWPSKNTWTLTSNPYWMVRLLRSSWFNITSNNWMMNRTELTSILDYYIVEKVLKPTVASFFASFFPTPLLWRFLASDIKTSIYFVRSLFFTNEPLTSWTLFSSKLDWGLSANLILIEKSVQLLRSSFIKKKLLTKSIL